MVRRISEEHRSCTSSAATSSSSCKTATTDQVVADQRSCGIRPATAASPIRCMKSSCPPPFSMTTWALESVELGAGVSRVGMRIGVRIADDRGDAACRPAIRAAMSPLTASCQLVSNATILHNVQAPRPTSRCWAAVVAVAGPDQVSVMLLGLDRPQIYDLRRQGADWRHPDQLPSSEDGRRRRQWDQQSGGAGAVGRHGPHVGPAGVLARARRPRTARAHRRATPPGRRCCASRPAAFPFGCADRERSDASAAGWRRSASCRPGCDRRARATGTRRSRAPWSPCVRAGRRAPATCGRRRRPWRRSGCHRPRT